MRWLVLVLVLAATGCAGPGLEPPFGSDDGERTPIGGGTAARPDDGDGVEGAASGEDDTGGKGAFADAGLASPDAGTDAAVPDDDDDAGE